MRSLLFVLLLILANGIFAQNLIPNPGFDVINSCPVGHGQVHLAILWSTASHGTPDVYNTCSSAQRISVPNAGHFFDSYQQPRSGKGYAEILVYLSSNGHHGIEYIETPLLSPLEPGQQYYLEFYVSPDFSRLHHWCYTDAIGLALTDTFYFEEIGPHEAMSLLPVIENKGTLVTDTVGWTRISGCHVAKGGEEFAIIGNFRSEQETLIEVEDTNVYPYINFFYIEDVLIMAFDPLPDTVLICAGNPVALNAEFLNAVYVWNTGETDSVIWASASGMYIVEALMDNCVLRDSVFVLDTKDVNGYPSDTVICSDESFALIAPLPGDYLWSDGSKNFELFIEDSGIYELTITNACGEFSYSTNVEAEECICKIFCPNVFSPNNDGINDLLEIYVGCKFNHQLLNFDLFDRWGGVVYSTTQGETISWDGTMHGMSLQNGVYVWTLEYEVIRNGTVENRLATGNVTMIR